MSTSIENLKPNIPEPIATEIEVIGLNRRMELQAVVDALLNGDYVLVRDFYSTGLAVMAALKKHLTNKFNDSYFQGQRDLRAAFREASQRLLVQVKDNKLALRKAPVIGWFKQLYHDKSDFLLSFPDIQGLNSSWQWYEKGIKFPVIKQRLHPYYGTYFPTRFEHLKLFANWLKTYKGSRKTAIDIGVGCGILSFQLLEQGFENVYATDININAIIGVNEEIKRMNIGEKLSLYFGDLFAPIHLKSELIIFNPPWLPSTSNLTNLDKAIYYDAEFFPRFFEQAHQHLALNGKVVIIFSNLAQKAEASFIHPIEEELLKGNRFKKEAFVKRNVNEASTKTKRNQTWRKEELVELWVLRPI